MYLSRDKHEDAGARKKAYARLWYKDVGLCKA